MKSKPQIKHYMEDKSFVTDMDFIMISSYCSQQIGLKLENPSPSPELFPITCQEFIDWINTGIEAGEVVRYNGFQGIVVNSNPKEARIYAQTDFKAPRFTFTTVPIQDIQPSPESHANRFLELLANSGHEFNRSTLEITKKYVPEKDDIVMFTAEGQSKGKRYGIFREVSEGIVYMYCYCDENDEVYYSPKLREPAGRVENLQFTKIDAQHYGRKKLETLLNRRKMSWNHSGKRIESVSMRAEKGKPYYYINDKMAVAEAKEDGSNCTSAAKRYWAGNYSKVRGKMMRCQEELADVLKKYMAEPE